MDRRTRADQRDTFADNQLAVLEYPKATACLRCNHNDPFGGPRRRFNLAGTRGGMEIRPMESGKFVLNLDRNSQKAFDGATQIGNRVRIHAGTILGSDGFGYVQEDGKHLKVPQIGNVEEDDDVEIGANVTIDRGALGPTHIGAGTKIDNLVQIAHNVSTGKNCLVVAQAGVAGSTKLGNLVTIAGQVGLAGHLRIGDNVTILGGAGVMRDIDDGGKWWGTPAQPDKKMKRQLLALQRLPDLLRRYNRFEKFAKSRLLTPEEIDEAKAKAATAKAARAEAKQSTQPAEAKSDDVA